MARRELEDLNEEFNNFMHRANEVNRIVKKLASTDEATRQIGTAEADQFLRDEKTTVYDNMEEDIIKLNLKFDKTLVNTKNLREDRDSSTMSQEAFMEEVSRDAERRHKDRLIREEKASTLKVQGIKAFRRNEYEKATILFTKYNATNENQYAIEQIKDSPLLYNNRALTYINLKLYEKALEDLNRASELNPTSLKSALLTAKVYFLQCEKKKYQNIIEDVKKNHKNQIDFINEYVEEINKMTTSTT